MRIFIAGKHKVVDVIGVRRKLNELGYFPTQLVRFDKAVGVFIPDIPDKDREALRALFLPIQLQIVD